MSQQKPLPFCMCRHNLLYSIDQRFRNYLPPAWERLKSPDKSFHLQDRSSSSSPLLTSSPPFPTKMNPLASKGWPAPQLTAGFSKYPITLEPSLNMPKSCQCWVPRTQSARVPVLAGPLQVPRGSTAISLFACTSHMTPSCLQACCWKSIYFSNAAL